MVAFVIIFNDTFLYHVVKIQMPIFEMKQLNDT